MDRNRRLLDTGQYSREKVISEKHSSEHLNSDRGRLGKNITHLVMKPQKIFSENILITLKSTDIDKDRIMYKEKKNSIY